MAQVLENGKAFFSYSYYAAEFAGRVGGINAFKSVATGVTFIAVFTAALAGAFQGPALAPRVNRRLALVPLVICLSSGVLHIGVAAISGLPLAARYTAALYALAPVALIALAAALPPAPLLRSWLGPRLLRAGAGALAAGAPAISLGTLYRTELLVNRPNRDFIAQLQPGTAYILRHAEWPTTTPNGAVLGSYPGFVSLYEYETANPFRMAWTTRLYLLGIKDVDVGTRCEIKPDGRVSVYFGSEARGTFPADAVKGGGLTSFWSRDFQWQPLDALCTAPKTAVEAPQDPEDSIPEN